MDIQMPELDGLEATGKILAHYANHQQKPIIIAMTANAQEDQEDECKKAGMKDFLSKPLFLETLNFRLNYWRSALPKTSVV